MGRDDHTPGDSGLEFGAACQAVGRTSSPMICLADPEDPTRHPPRRFVPMLEPGRLRGQGLVFMEWSG